MDGTPVIFTEQGVQIGDDSSVTVPSSDFVITKAGTYKYKFLLSLMTAPETVPLFVFEVDLNGNPVPAGMVGFGEFVVAEGDLPATVNLFNVSGGTVSLNTVGNSINAKMTLKCIQLEQA